jgi:serine/threonine-protein phosphatase 2B catalytic subunit
VEELKGLCPDKKIPRGLLMEGTDALRDAVEAFSKAKKWDLINERRPTKKS